MVSESTIGNNETLITLVSANLCSDPWHTNTRYRIVKFPVGSILCFLLSRVGIRLSYAGMSSLIN